MDHASVALPRRGSAFPGPIRDTPTALALAGTKTATTGLLVETDLDGEAVAEPGSSRACSIPPSASGS